MRREINSSKDQQPLSFLESRLSGLRRREDESQIAFLERLGQLFLRHTTEEISPASFSEVPAILPHWSVESPQYLRGAAIILAKRGLEKNLDIGIQERYYDPEDHRLVVPNTDGIVIVIRNKFNGDDLAEMVKLEHAITVKLSIRENE